MFIQPCFIRKNTPELRKKLEELGYLPPSKVWYNENFAICVFWRDNNGEYLIYEIDDDFERIIAPNYPFIDCGENEDLFLALAALRDDTDINQWFIYNSMDCIIEKLRTIDWFICNENSIEDFACYDSSYLNCHKATVEEIIEHSKIIEKKYNL
jgi:hypothetical protein